MLKTDLNFRVNELSDTVNMLKAEIKDLKRNSFEHEMWDNSDMIRNWKISQRTLASWRANGLIDYVQIGGKIWYTKRNRNSFILRNSIKAKNVEISTCCNNIID